MSRKTPTKYYLGYGSNLNMQQMMQRCPNAEPLDKLYLKDYILRFRGVADMIHRKGARCPIGLWKITRDCEKALDAYEGVSRNPQKYPGLYSKRYLLLNINGKDREVLWYQMNSRGIMPPSESYFASILDGYDDFGLEDKLLYRALEHSWERKNKTPFLRYRYMRKGRPALARVWEEDYDEDVPVEQVPELDGKLDWPLPEDIRDARFRTYIGSRLVKKDAA